MRPVAVFCDQLSVENMRGLHESRKDGITAEQRLEGLMPAISDFHEKMNFLQVINCKFVIVAIFVNTPTADLQCLSFTKDYKANVHFTPPKTF